MQRFRRASGFINEQPLIIKGILIFLIVFLLCFCASSIFITNRLLTSPPSPPSPQPPKPKIPTNTAVITQLQDMERLETTSYTIEKVITYDPVEGSFWHFLGSQLKLFVIHGIVVAGFDFSELTKATIEGKELETASITLTMPPPKILQAYVDAAKTSIYDASTGVYAIWSKGLDAETTNKILKNAQNSIQDDACQAELLKKAAESGRKQMTSLLETMGFSKENITVNVPDATCYKIT